MSLDPSSFYWGLLYKRFFNVPMGLDIWMYETFECFDLFGQPVMAHLARLRSKIAYFENIVVC